MTKEADYLSEEERIGVRNTNIQFQMKNRQAKKGEKTQSQKKTARDFSNKSSNQQGYEKGMERER